MIFAERFGTGQQAYCWQDFRRSGFGRSKKISEEKAQPLGFFRFGPMMICLIVRYLFWLLHHK